MSMEQLSKCLDEVARKQASWNHNYILGSIRDFLKPEPRMVLEGVLEHPFDFRIYFDRDSFYYISVQLMAIGSVRLGFGAKCFEIWWSKTSFVIVDISAKLPHKLRGQALPFNPDTLADAICELLDGWELNPIYPDFNASQTAVAGGV